MPKCLMSKHGVSIHTDGTISPCCAWRAKPGQRHMFTNDSSWVSRHEKIYEDLLDTWLPECEQCEISEQATGRSLRTDSDEYFTDESVGIEYWDFKLNTSCNLACKMCGAHSSSSWERDIRNNPKLSVTEYALGFNKPKAWKENGFLKIQNFYPELVKAKYVKFTGGEPFLIPEVKQCIEFLVNSDSAKNIELQITTNGTQDMVAWFPLLKHFKHVILGVSAEATGDLYNYIRQYASWDTVADNLIKCNQQKPDNVHLTVNFLPMSLNIGADVELEAWCTRNNIDMFRAGPVNKPDFMSPEAATDPELKSKLIRHLKMLDNIYKTDYTKVCDYL